MHQVNFSATGKKIKFCSGAIILYLVLVSCGCISQSPGEFEKNQSQFADEVLASRGYYDNLVREDPLNASAWCLRGNYYNNASASTILHYRAITAHSNWIPVTGMPGSPKGYLAEHVPL